ncbi:acetyl-CoA carboxylase biotin carboxyl carrier protein subunit [Ichthyenterobacterium sp. W332]|uniref:Acetyl-CoA carboxylase biotin carboxyl carrier protein subunit n=1 Tax=Microcosmobacter mediterraneus TaxID=3075607 RepID=A0ABU2YKF7_9FLAO|nr:acetyl-CoA carboxylase biotin carboxyl carrier protein subunit [Ichthyenterobacterium sp. W332]MDT0558654.1 acetyl-CoA carboxylase biotin carboxyl carrier protein subunit [Ichthyenterobacterium sp. W332]
MNSNYKIKVNSNYTFDIDSETATNLDSTEIASRNYHLLKDSKAYDAKIINTDFNSKSYVLEVNGNSYNVEIKDGLDQLISEMGFSIGNSKKIDSIKAPMPGLILEISVSEGQQVAEGDNLVILEAMKMENVITSPRDGIVKSVEVKQGDAIEKNTLILKFE